VSGTSLVGFPLSPQQRRVWRLAERPGAGAFGAWCRLRLRGDLNPAALRAALEHVVARHEILRTRFDRLPGMSLPVQVPLGAGEPGAGPLWDEVGGLGAPAVAPGATAGAGHGRPAAPPVVATLIRHDAADHQLLLALPALCADLGTLENLTAELVAAYAAVAEAPAAAAHPPGPPHAPIPLVNEPEALTYAQFAEWQNGLLEGEDAVDGRAFWTGLRLAEVPPLRLPAAAKSRPTFGAGTAAVELDAAAARRIEAAAEAAGASTEVFLLAAWLVLLWRLTGREDLLCGRLAAGRDHELLRPAFGLFARLLPVRVDVAPHLPWSEILRRVAGWLETTEEWQESFLPADALPEGADAGDNDDHFAAAFAWQPPAGAAGLDRSPLGAGGVRFEIERLEARVERADLLLAAIPTPDGGLTLELRYDASRNAGADMESLAGCLPPLLASAAARPAAPVAELDLLADPELRALSHPGVEAASFAAPALDPSLPLHRHFEAQAARTPQRLAVALPLADAAAADAGLTYGELNARANRLARHLRTLGVGSESPVGVLLPRSPELLVALWAVLKAGGAFLPLDLAWPPARLAALLAESGAALLLTAGGDADGLADLGPAVRILDFDAAAADIAAHAAHDLTDLPDDAAGADGLAYVIHTSGTSGIPKGVMVEHRSVVHLANALAATIYSRHGAALRVSLNAPFTFDSSVKQWIQLLFGHTLQLVPEDVRLDGERYVAFLRRHRVDVLDCTPSQLRLLLAAGLGAPGPVAVLVGGEAIDAASWQRFAELEAAGPIRFYNVYGPTECTVDTTARARAGASPRPTLGPPLPGIEAWVLDPLRLPTPLPLPPGFAGELWIGGAGVARGYLGRPDLTADRFRPAPVFALPAPGGAGGRAYRSGDLVRRVGDELEFVGRADRQVKVRGLRVELEEIERMLMAHPAVRQAAVTLVPPAAPPSGDADGAQLAAYVGLRGTSEAAALAAAAAELRGWLRDRLPEPMVPAFLVPLADLPLTASGKVDHRALPDARQAALARAQAAYVEPRSEAERQVAAVWQEVLGVPVIGVDDNFFDLGGHSLLMVRAHGRLQEAFGRPIPMVELFRFPTVGSLAAFLAGAAAGREGADALSLDAVRARAGRQHEDQERQRQAQQRARVRLAPSPAAPAVDDEVTR
jgi:amino acid adenylation domain-containing protein